MCHIVVISDIFPTPLFLENGTTLQEYEFAPFGGRPSNLRLDTFFRWECQTESHKKKVKKKKGRSPQCFVRWMLNRYLRPTSFTRWTNYNLQCPLLSKQRERFNWSYTIVRDTYHYTLVMSSLWFCASLDSIWNALWKHAYLNILRILPPKKLKLSDSGSFCIPAQNIDCGYLLELPRRGGYNGYPQSMFLSRNKKK